MKHYKIKYYNEHEEETTIYTKARHEFNVAQEFFLIKPGYKYSSIVV